MATYEEMAKIINGDAEGPIDIKIQGYLLRKASLIANEASLASRTRLDFALRICKESQLVSKEIKGYVIGDMVRVKSDATQGSLLNPADASVEAAVNTYVDKFYP
jgi:hypothetical protein